MSRAIILSYVSFKKLPARFAHATEHKARTQHDIVHPRYQSEDKYLKYNQGPDQNLIAL